jgi:hypothetical protein
MMEAFCVEFKAEGLVLGVDECLPDPDGKYYPVPALDLDVVILFQFHQLTRYVPLRVAVCRFIILLPQFVELL